MTLFKNFFIMIVLHLNIVVILIEILEKQEIPSKVFGKFIPKTDDD